MGEFARKFSIGNTDELLKLLNKAYADEWIAYFYYQTGAALLKSLNGKITADQLTEMAEDEEEHRKQLCERIVELGGKPVSEWDEISKQANYPKITYPISETDWQGFLRAVLDAERGAIEVYGKLVEFLRQGNGDPVTFHVIRHILQEEMEHEEEIETLLGI